MDSAVEIVGEDLWTRREAVERNISSVRVLLSRSDLPPDKRVCLEYQLGCAERGLARIEAQIQSFF